jgi:hypothetical protein
MTLLHRIRRARVAAIPVLLGLLLLRAAVPAGFMPLGGNPLQLQLCSAGMPGALAPLLEGAGHGHATHGQDCPFGHSPAGGPASDVVAFPPLAVVPPRAPAGFESFTPGLQLAQAHRARAPPACA